MNLKNKEKVEFKGAVKYAYKLMGKALAQYQLLEDRDKLLAIIFGSKEDLALLELLKMRQSRVPINFKIAVCFLRCPLIKIDALVVNEYLAAAGWEYREEVIGRQEDDFLPVVFAVAGKLRCNKILLTDTLDNFVDSVLINMFFNGQLSGLGQKQLFPENNLMLIRPLCYLEKQQLTVCAQKFSFPNTGYVCAKGRTEQEQLVDYILAKLARPGVELKKNVFNSLARIKKDYLL
jgi:tRNA 2-thiocytidine biosynthesis protein TtcA